MSKKFNFILLSLLLLISLSAVSAVDDLNETQSSDEIILDEEAVLSASDNENVLTSDYTIKESDYSTYFASNGNIISSKVNVGDTLYIDGSFSGKSFNIDKKVNIVGTSSNSLKNCIFTFSGDASGSSILNLNIANTNTATYGIFLNGVSNCIISGCTIKNTGASSYPICVANSANYNNVTDNKLTTYGETYGHGTRSTPALLISGAHYNYVANNDILCDDANAIYLSSYNGGPLKGGDSNFNTIYNNTIKYNVLPTSWAYGIQVMGSNNTMDSNRIIGAYIGISAGINALVINNRIINTTGANFNDPTVEVGGDCGIVASAGSTVRNNTITNAKVGSTGSGISISSRGIVEDNYVEIVDSGVGIMPLASNIVIQNNIIRTVSGAGIMNSNAQFFNLYVLYNNITSNTGVGVLIKKESSKKMPGNITIMYNTIFTNNKISIDASQADASLECKIGNSNTILNKNSIIVTPQGSYDPSKHYYDFSGTTYNVTPENYGDYIGVNGNLNTTLKDGDILSFTGEFSNKYIYINNAVKLTSSSNAVFYNTTFRVTSDSVWIENLKIINSYSERINAWGVLIYNVTGVTVQNCTISVYDPNAAYAIYVLEADEVDIKNNTLSSEGNYLTYTLLAHTVTDCNFTGNVIYTNGTGEVHRFENDHCLEGNSVCTDGSTVCTDGSTVCTDGNATGGSHVLKEVYRTYGILMVYSSDNYVSDNKVRVTSKLNKTYSTYNSTNSIVGIDLYYNSHNNVFSNNDVYVWGYDNYIYGMGVLGYYTTMTAPEGQGAMNNQFIDNTILVEGGYCVEGIIIGSSSDDTLVEGNTVKAIANNVTYGINLEVSKTSIVMDNKVTLTSQIVYGLEAFKSDGNTVEDNEFTITANQAYGIVFSEGNNNQITSNIVLITINNIDSNLSNISVKSYDTIKAGYGGIYFTSYSQNNNISYNNVTITKGYAVVMDEDAINNVISYNYLNSQNGTGNEGVLSSSVDNTIKYNYVYLISGNLEDVDIKYMENGTFIFKTDDENLNGAIVIFMDDFKEIINQTVISDGNATFVYDFNGFKDHTPGDYIFYAEVYQDNYKVTEFETIVHIDYGDLIVVVDNVTGSVARNTQYSAVIKNILGNPVSGIAVEFYVNDEGFEVYVAKGVSDENGIVNVTAEIPKVYSDNPYVILEITNPDNYESTSATANLTARWLTNTKIDLNTNVYSGAALATLKDAKGNVLADRDVTVKVGNTVYTLKTDSEGTVLMPAVLRGTYSVTVTFNGDDDYYDSAKTSNVNVPALISQNKDTTVYYGNTIQYKIRVKGSDGTYSAGNTVTIKVNGQTYKVSTDKNGYATKALKLKAGSYTITAEFNGDKVSNKLTFKPTLTAKNIVKKKAKKIKFSVKVVNKNGKAVKKKKVTFKIKGKKYKAKTNKKGVATASIKNLKVGKYTITSTYGGCTIKNTIKIKK